VKVVSFVAAASRSGKTTLIEKVLTILKSRGLRVAVVKHASKGFELDRPGKDSWRFQQAGADAVVLFGPDGMAVMKHTTREPAIAELVSAAGNVDIIIVEGNKLNACNRIEVFRAGISGERPLCMKGYSCIALVSDVLFDAPIPRFDINDAQGIAEFLMSNESLHLAV